MGKVYNIKRQAWYLSKYLSGDDFERYFFSQEWVFPGWVSFSQWIKKEFGDYPPRDMLVRLGRMNGEEREEDTWFGGYFWDCKRKKIDVE